MMKDLNIEQHQVIRDLLLTHYNTANPRIIAAVENKAGVPTFAVSLRDGQFITIAEIIQPTVPVTVDKFAMEWINEKINGTLGEAVKNALKKRGKVNYQAFEVDSRDDNNKSVRRIQPFGTIEFTEILPHTQFNFDYYKDEINHLAETIPSLTADFKKHFQKIQSLQNSLKETLIEPNKKKELFEKLQESYVQLENKQSAEKAELEKNSAANYADIKTKCEAALNGIKENKTFKETREALSEIQNLLNDKDLKREQRNELYELVHACYAEIDKRREEEQEEYEKTTSANYEAVKPKLEAFQQTIANSENVQETREALKKLQAETWETRLKKEHRSEVHDTFNKLFEALSQRYEALKFQFENESNANKDELALRVEEVEKFVASSTDLKATKEQLKAMQKQLNEMKLTPYHRQELWNLIDKAFKEVNKKMDEAFGDERKVAEENYAKIKPQVEAAVEAVKSEKMFKEAREKMKAGFDLIKDKELKLMPRQRQELWKMLEQTNIELNEKADKFFANRKVEREQKEKEWLNRQADRMFKMEKLVKHLQQENLDEKTNLGNMEDWLNKVRDNAATKEFRQSILDKIEASKKLTADRLKRIDDIKNELKDMRQKMREADEKKKQEAAEDAAKAQEKANAAKEKTPTAENSTTENAG